jgi:hypothetical protein
MGPTSRRRDSVSRFALLASIAALAACGGDAGREAVAGTTSDRKPATTQPPNLGCDVVVQCFPTQAQATLDRCPPDQLDARGREARKRLERLLARIADVDLHNEQAYEATDAAMAALAEFEEACL